MAKRSGAANLAGLAALGALGYMALKGKKGEDKTARDVEESVFTGPMKSDDSDMRRRAEAEGAKVSPAEADGPGPRDAQSMDGIDYTAGVTKRVKPVAPKATRTVGGPDERYTAGSTAPQAETPRGTAGADMSAYKPRYTPSPLAPKFVQGKTYPPRSVITDLEPGMKRGGKVKKMASGGMTTSSASKRADGIAQKGKTRGKMY